MDEAEYKQICNTILELNVNLDDVVDLLYLKFFQIAPSIQPLFANVSMELHKKKFVGILSLCTKLLETEGKKMPQMLVDLGARHLKYGARAEFIVPLSEALLFSLKQNLGEEKFNQTQQLWNRAITVMTDLVKKGMDDPKYKVPSYDSTNVCPIQ